jgi:low affinity Fe/Cu permease
MASSPKKNKKNFFDAFATKVTQATGSTPVFIGALSIVIIWGISGPIFDYSETWQLVINTGTTIITFLMVFLIQKSQNKDSLAVHIKLNELVASHKLASNRLIDVEDMTEDEMRIIEKYFVKLNELSKAERSIAESYSEEAADKHHKYKSGIEKELDK